VLSSLRQLAVTRSDDDAAPASWTDEVDLFLRK
jgi:hypothetical protein